MCYFSFSENKTLEVTKKAHYLRSDFNEDTRTISPQGSSSTNSLQSRSESVTLPVSVLTTNDDLFDQANSTLTTVPELPE